MCEMEHTQQQHKVMLPGVNRLEVNFEAWAKGLNYHL